MKTRAFFFAMMLLIGSFSLSAASNHKVKETRITHLYQIEAEEELALENWMVNECYWKCKEINCMRRDYDNTLELESWMVDQKTWDLAVLVSVEKEEKLKLEEWMTDNDKWLNNELKEKAALKASLVQND